MSALEIQEWQIKEIKKGIDEADAGELVSHESVVKLWEEKLNRHKLFFCVPLE